MVVQSFRLVSKTWVLQNAMLAMARQILYNEQGLIWHQWVEPNHALGGTLALSNFIGDSK